MKHRDRVLCALQHETPDRCPMQISFTPEFEARLRRDIGLPPADPSVRTYDLECALGQDMLLAPAGWIESPRHREADSGLNVNEWGVRWRDIEYQTRFGSGVYTEIASHPLAADAAIESYRPPDPECPEWYSPAQDLIRSYQSEYWIVGMTVCTIFETAWALRGYERLLTDFVLDPDLAGRILDIPFRHHLTAAGRLVDLGVDMIWIGDDVGAQSRMLISPATWRKLLKPRLAAFIDALKQKKPGLTVAYHTDGCIYPIIPDLIEIGVDVLNPVQPQSMDPDRLKRDYGDRLCFWGTIDIQQTLPYGTPEDVRAEVRQRISTVGRQGGLILGPTHNVQLDTPLDNFHAMVQAITADGAHGDRR